MTSKFSSTHQDPFILQCCLPEKRQSYIGVDALCDKNAVFCLQHSSHLNTEGLMHQMMPLRDFRRKIDQRRYQMQSKVQQLIDTFSKFIDQLVQQIKEIKIKKILQLSMLWLRDLASSEEQYELMKKVYRMDFKNVSCKDVQSIYYKIIHNKQLYGKQINQVNCYKGIYKVLSQLSESKAMVKALSQKLVQIEGVLTNGQILKKVLPDHKLKNEQFKQVLLQQMNGKNDFEISYNKSKVMSSDGNYRSFVSKYAIIPHITYHIYIKTKYSNIMVGICGQAVKDKGKQKSTDLHYLDQVVMFNCANGNTYKEGMFISGSKTSIQDLNELNIKLRLTDNQIFVMTNKSILTRQTINHINGCIYLLCSARTEGDQFQIYCDNDISADNVRVLQLINQKPQIKQIQAEKINQPIVLLSRNEAQPKQISQNNNKLQISQNQPQLFRQNTFGAYDLLKKFNQQRNLRQTNQQNFNIKESTSNQADRISKIRTSLHQIKNNIKKDERQQEDERQKNWAQQKSKYLSDIKQKITMLKQQNSRVKKDQKKKQEQQKVVSKKTSKQIDGQLIKRVKSQSSRSGNQINPHEISDVKINLSDEISDMNSIIKISMMSNLRKQSDNINIYDIKLRQNSHMVESIEPVPAGNEATFPWVAPLARDNLNKMKTPPKMNGLIQF